MDDFEDLQRDAVLREQMTRLPRERKPDPAVEERLVLALRREGSLGPRRWYRRSVPVPLVAAAGFLLFAAGAVAGRGLAHRADTASASGPAATSPSSQASESPPHGGLIIRM